MKMNRSRGFTLLELLVVVIVVGILASVALPQFGKMMLRSRVTEATNMVGSILTAELVYYQEHTTFTDTKTDLLATIPADGDSWFNYVLSGASATNSQVVAKGNDTTVNGGKVPTTVTVTGTINEKGSRTITTSGA